MSTQTEKKTEQLNNLIKEYVATKAVAETIAEKLDPRVRPGWQGRITQAKAELPKIMDRYIAGVLPMCAPVYVTGEGLADLTAKCKEEALVTVVRPLELIDRLTDFVERNLGATRAFTPHMHRQIFTELRNACFDLGMVDIVVPEYKSANLQTKEDTIKYVKNIVFNVNEGEMFTLLLKRQATQGAIDAGFTGPVILVFIDGLTQEDQQQFNTNTFRIDPVFVALDGKVTDTVVTNVLKQVKTNVKAAKQGVN